MARRWGVGAAACAAALVAASPAAVFGASTPAKDSFAGSITAATGTFAGDRGAVSIALAPGPGTVIRRLAVTIQPRPCVITIRCVRLAGRLTGTLTRGPLRVPDVGQSFKIVATGTIKPLGQVSATGTVQGTGFIAHGHESLKLKLTGAGGSVTIDAVSALVPGFTSP